MRCDNRSTIHLLRVRFFPFWFLVFFLISDFWLTAFSVSVTLMSTMVQMVMMREAERMERKWKRKEKWDEIKNVGGGGEQS